MSIEAATMSDMLNREIMPSISEYCAKVCKSAKLKKEMGLSITYETEQMKELSENLEMLYKHSGALEKAHKKAKAESDVTAAAGIFLHKVIPEMNACRKYADKCEIMMPKANWAYPSYGDIINTAL